jgi:hypothetical protein
MNLQTILTDIATYGPYVIAAAAAAMAALPQGKKGGWWDTVRTIVNFLAMNWGHAKNVQEKP